jgi:hypothetical protein
MDYIDRIKTLYGISDDEASGFSEIAIDEAEEKGGFKFPQALREYYARLGKCHAPNASFNRILGPDEAVLLEASKHLVFCLESQGAVYWAFEKEDLEEANPKVLSTYNIETSDQVWLVDSDTTEGFLASMAYWNGVLGGLDFCANYMPDEGSLDKSMVEAVERNWIEITEASNTQFRFFTEDDREIIALTIDEGGEATGIHVGTGDEDRFIDILDKLDVDWNYRSDEDDEKD